MSMEEERAKFWDGMDAAVSDEALRSVEAVASAQNPMKDLRKVLDKQVGGTHYQHGMIQPVEYIVANNLNFLEGSVIKRVTRHAFKDGAKDILKAIQELTFIAASQYGVIVNIDVEEGPKELKGRAKL